MPSAERPASWLERVLWLSVAAAGLTVLGIAAFIDPDPRGFGTHTQLGLPPCGFLALTGFPCPGCGLTTAFAHGVRGDLWLAGVSNPLGVLLFAIVVVSIPTALVAAWRGWSWGDVLSRPLLNRAALGIAGFATVLWVVRFARVLWT